MKSISVLGCGWLGLPVASFLVQKGYEVKGSTTKEEKLIQLAQHGIKPFLIKVKESVLGQNLAQFFQSELLILNIPPGRRNPNVITDHPKQIEAVLNLALAGSVKKLIFISSTGVYGNENQIVTEEVLPSPTTSSGKALIVIEKMLQSTSNLSTTILRMSGLVGGSRKAGRFLAGKTNVANGDAPVNLVHREDCIQVLYKVIQQRQWGEVFNICTDQHPTRKAFYAAQAQKEGLTPPHFLDDDKISYKIISNEKVKRALDYTFLHPDPMLFP